MISVGTSDKANTTEAVEEAVRRVLDGVEDRDSIGLVLAMCSHRHDPAAFLELLRSHFGKAQIVGGSAIGTIAHTLLGYSGYECAIAVWPPSLPQPTVLVEQGLDESEWQAGHRLGARLRECTGKDDTILLFYDSVQSSPPPVLSVGSRLLDGLYAGLDRDHVNIVGAGLVSDFRMTGSFVFDGQQVAKQAVVAVAMPPGICSHTTIMHGCIPVSSFLEITRIEGPVVYELDGRPALEVLYKLLGVDPGTQQFDRLALDITLGKKHGELFAPYDEAAYVNRLIINANPDDGSVTLFEADFEVGARVQIMSRDNQKTLESVERRVPELLRSLGSKKPFLALYIDCAGRSSAFSGSETEEAATMLHLLGPDIPVLGFYSGVEIAPLLGRSRPLDWTGVLTLLTLEGE